MSKMEAKQLACQNCDQQYDKIKDFKMHVRSHSHKKVVADLFHTAVHKGPVFLPSCVVLYYLRNPNERHPIIGLDMVTLFITPEMLGCFYLCHVCKQNLCAEDIIQHLCSEGHYFNCLSYSNPELLRFAWLKDSFSYLESSAMNERSINGPGTIRIFELPGVMLKTCKERTYHQVMTIFSEVDHLLERVVAGRTPRKTLQAYITDPARTNPLLGLNFLIEYSCPENEQLCGYLCLLCKKKLHAIESISHCISFDHVFCYLKASHPAMMDCPKGSYTNYSYGFHKKIFSLATRVQKENPPGELQNVHVDLSHFEDIYSCNYETALEKLQPMRNEGKQSVRTATVAPGDQISLNPETQKSSGDLATTDSPAEQTAAKKLPSHGQDKEEQPCSILCMECDETFISISNYKTHVKGRKHTLKLAEIFGQDLYRGGRISLIKLYQYMWSLRGKTRTSPLIGLRMLTVFVDRQSPCLNPAIYLCHACELNIPVSSVCTHLSSPKHYFNVFKCTNPDLVYLVSQNSAHLKEFVQEVDVRQGKEGMVLRVCEIPGHLSEELRNMAYKKIIRMLSSKLRQCVEVQTCMTLQSYSKSSDRKSPLLGLQFMVKYSTALPYPKCGYLCLLCESKLPEMDAIAHVLSFAHVFAYLNVVHPGSLNKEDGEKRSLITDLAMQAQNISSGALQEVELKKGKYYEVETSTFKTALNTLQLIFKEKGLGELKPSVAPSDKLVPSYEKINQKNSSPCIKEESSPMTSRTDQINPDAVCTDTAKMVKNTDSHSAHITQKHVEPLNNADSASAFVHPVESSVQATVQLHDLTPAPSPLPVPSHTHQSDLQKEDKQFNKAVHPCHNPTTAKELCPIMKCPQPQDTSFTQKQTKKRVQKTGESPTPVKNVRQAVPSSKRNSKNNSSQCVKDTSLTDQINPNAVCTNTANMVKNSDSQSAHLTSKHVDPLKNANSASAFVHPVESSVQATAQLLDLTPALSPLPVPSLTHQSDPQKEDKQFNKAVRPCHNPTTAKGLCPTVKCPQPQDTNFTQKQTKKRAQKTGKSPTPVKNRIQKVSQTSPTYTELWDYLKTPNREPVIGLRFVTECHTEDKQPFYMCMACTERISENSIVKHLTSQEHQHLYLKSIDYVPLVRKKNLTTKWLRTQAIMVEKSQGYGEAQVLDLEAEDYHQILSAPILTALGKLRDSLHKLISIDETNPLAASSLNICAWSSDENHGSKVLSKVERTEEKDAEDAQMPNALSAVKAENSEPDADHLTVPVSNDPMQSSPHLWSCLTSPTRTEPVIGLSMITEYRTSTHQNSFLCSCCEVIHPTSKYMAHLVSTEHRFNYIKTKHSELVALWGDQIKLTCKIAELREKATILQDKEGWGSIKVVEKEPSKKKEPGESKSLYSDRQGVIREAGDPEPPQACGETASPTHQDQNKLNLSKREIKKKDKPGAMIGLNFVTCVSNGKKKLLFCELCLIRCRHLDHLCSVTHRKIYMEQKYPGWNANGVSVVKLNKMALRLAAVEKSAGIGMKKVKVNDEVFTVLRTAPLSTALSKLQLLQTNSHAVVKLSASPSSLQTNPNTSSNHTNGNGLVQEDQAPFMEKSHIPDEVPSRVHSYPICPVDPCSLSSVSASSCPSLSSASTTLKTPSTLLTPTTNLYVPDRSYSPISPPLSPCYSPSCDPLPLSSPIPGQLPLPSQPDAPPQCQSAPPPLYISVFSHTPETACQYSPHDGLSHSTTLPPHVNPTASLPTRSTPPPVFRTESDSSHNTQAVSFSTSSVPVLSPAPHSSSLLAKPQSCVEQKTGDTSQLVYEQSALGEAVTPPHMYSFPNLPTVAGQSRASAFLSVSNTEPVIGLCNILECRKIPQATFFLCLNCAEHINRVDICDHMTSEKHQYLSIRAQYPEIFKEWQWKTVCNLMIGDLSGRLALLEKHLDAKVIMLNEKQYECLRSVDFHDAIKILQQMYGPEQDRSPSLTPCFTEEDQRKREIYAARVPQHNVETDRKAHSPQPQESCNLSPSQTKDCLHTSQAPHRGCANSLAFQSQSTARGSPPGAPGHTLPCITRIKQEKPDQESHESCGPPSLGTASSTATVTLFKQPSALKQYVNSKRTATEAVVGLSSVIECLSEGQPPLYLCISCSSKLNHDLIINHLLKCGHRNSYMRARYPWLFEDRFDSDSRTQSRALMWLAHKVETGYEDEPGQLQEMKIECADLKEIRGIPFDKALRKLKKIRKKQNLCALQTCVSPKIRKDLVKQEKVETEVTAQQELLDFPGTTPQEPRTPSKRKAANPHLFDCSPPLVKQLKVSSDIQSKVISSQKVVEVSASRPENKESFPHYKSNKPTLTSSEQTKSVAKTKPEGSMPASSNAKFNAFHPQLTPQSSHYTSEEDDAQMCNQTITKTAGKHKQADTHTNISKSDTRPIQTLCISKLQTTAQESKASTITDETSPKENGVGTKSHSNPATKTEKVTLQYCSFTASDLKWSSSTEISSVPSEFPVKKSRKSGSSDDVTDSLSQIQKKASGLHTVNSDESLPFHCVPLPSKESSMSLLENSTVCSAKGPEISSSSLGGLDSSSQICKKAMSSKPLVKTVCTAEDSVVSSQGRSSILAPQQENCHSETGTATTPSVEVQGLEIARLPDTRPSVKKRSNENAWNYENRQFNSETYTPFNKSLVTNSISESVAMKEQHLLVSQQNYGEEQNQDSDWRISTNNWNSSAFACTENEFNPSSISLRSYPVQTNHANANIYLSLASGCTPATPCVSPVAHEHALSYQFSGFSHTRPASASKPAYQTQPVYQSFQNSEMGNAYNGVFASKQALHPNQTTTVNENVTGSAASHVYEGFLYPVTEWQ